MRVTIDIPEGYECKIVPSEYGGAVLMEFTTFTDHEVAGVMFETAKTLFSRIGWTGFSIHSHPAKDSNKTRYVVIAEKMK